MGIGRKTLAAKFNVILIGIFFLGTLVTGGLTWRMLVGSAQETVQHSIDAQLGILEASLNSLRGDAERGLKAALAGLADLAPAPYSLHPDEVIGIGGQNVPNFRSAGRSLVGNNAPCDQVSLAAGSVCSLFVRRGEDFIRVASSVKKPDGSRAVGTIMDRKSGSYLAAMKGDDSVSINTVQGKIFIAWYRPVRDAAQQVIGIIAVGYDLSDRLATFKKQLSALKLGETGYFYALDASPTDRRGVFLSHPSLEGKSALGTKTPDGQSIIETMLDKKNGVIRYDWLNAGESAPRTKLAVYRHVASWDWIIAGGSYIEELTRDARQAILGLVIGLVIQAVIMIFVIARLFAVQISRPLGAARETIAAIAGGDLGRQVSSDREDEIGEMLRSVEQMRNSLAEMIGAVRGAAREIDARANSLSRAANRSGVSAREQSDSASAIAAMIEELHASLAAVEGNASEVKRFADQTSEQSKHGNQVIIEATTDMNRIAEQIGRASSVVAALAQQAGNINEVVDVIKGLADQTNLLALNAAIEAARAGEAGRGFAVVADEVRKLAEGTRQSTEKIGTVVDSIQSRSVETTDAMGTVSGQVQHGVDLAGQAREAMASIRAGADDLTEKLDAITLSLKEQNIAGAEIARNIEQVAHKSSEAANDANVVMDDAARMESLAQTLGAAVARFR